MQVNKNRLALISILFFILLLPFLFHNSKDTYNPLTVDDVSIGYYQSTTCNISLLEVYQENLNNQNIRYNAHNMLDLNVTELLKVDKVDNTYSLDWCKSEPFIFSPNRIVCGLLLLLEKMKKRISNLIIFL